jgi:hypothetical protein
VSIRYKIPLTRFLKLVANKRDTVLEHAPFTRSHVIGTVGVRHGDASSGSEDPFSSMGTRMAKVETELERAQVTDGSRCPARSREAAVRAAVARLACVAAPAARVRALLGLASRHRRRALPVLRFEMDRPARVRVPVVRADAAPDSGLHAVASASRVVTQTRSGQFRRA